MNRIENASAQFISARQDGPAGESDDGVGRWHGETVQPVPPKDLNDILTDAAEEISFEHSERVESKKLEEREIEEQPELPLPPVESILAYLEAATRDDPQEKLKHFVDDLKRNAERGGEGTSPREESRRQFGNVTEQFLALSFAAGELAREGGHEALLKDVRATLEELHDDSGAHIRADINTVEAAAAFGQGDAGRIEALQACYRDAVLDGQDLAAMLTGTLERFGDGDYRAAVQHLIRALGDDLSGLQGSSVQAQQLNAVLKDLYSMEVLATVLDGCQALAIKLHSEHAVAEPSAGELLKDLVSVCAERWCMASRFGAIADKHGAETPEPRVTFLGGVRNMVRNIPIKIFADPDSRSNILEAAQGALDEAVALEEQA
jgi:type III secretion protein W